MFKYRLTKTQFDALEEAKKAFYALNENGDYILQVEGAVDRSKIDEFRNNNIQLSQQLERFKGVDPDKIAEMLENERKIAEKKLIDAGDIEGLVTQRTTTMKQTYEGTINELQNKLNTSNRQLETLLIDNAVRAHAIKIGVTATAVDDVLLRAKTMFKVDDGQPVAKDAKGQIVYGKDGTNPLSIDEWMGGLKEQAPHLFGDSKGGGSSNGGRNVPTDQKLTPAQKISQGLGKGSSILT